MSTISSKRGPASGRGSSAVAVVLVAAGLCLATGCATAPTPGEPPRESGLDRFNKGSSDFNYWMQQNALIPLAKGYNWVVPKPGQELVDNFVTNLQRPRDMINSLLQGKFERSGRHLAHFLLNSVFGFGGLLYVSHRVLDDDSPETFNETLGAWGVPTGPYIVLPLVLPIFDGTSPRGLVGYGGDLVTNPLFWVPGTTGTILSLGTATIGGLNTVALFMPDPLAGESEWQAFEELSRERVPYEEARDLFFENQRLDVED
ncbi:MAG: MlaA family lipoprotein [Myxococcota bacterium]